MDLEKALRTFFIILFIIFVTVYILYNSGYYEYELHKKVELTNEQIEKFENDVKNNKDIDISDYTGNSTNDYSNAFSDVSASFSNFTSKYVKKGINGVFTIIGRLMQE